MKKIFAVIGTLVFVGTIMGCSGHKRHHDAPMGDPSAYKAHFGDMDANGDERVTSKEFKSYFPDSSPQVFKTLDMNKDGAVDHDEWHEFKEAHGLRDH